MKPVDKDSESEIQQFYAGRSVFITGVTGFIGKLLLEKLLRCCPDLKKVYLLIRPKKEKSPEKRLEILLTRECFGPLEEKFPLFRNKIVLVVGDLQDPRCGISDEDLAELQKDVSVVFHSGANVNFLESLRKAVQSNVIGTRNVLEICKTLPQLQAFIHVSTAFVRRNADYTVPEEVGGCHVQPKDIFKFLSFLDDEALKKINSNLIQDKVTTYQLSKALAELLIEREKEHVPATIVRPCLVNSSWKEPLPGWCDIYQGINGLAIATGRGFLRTLYVPPNCRFMVIPADVVVNCIITSAWYTATKRPEGTFVVNCTMQHEDSPFLHELLRPLLELKDKYPLTTIYRCPDLKYSFSKWKNDLHALVEHYLPAIVIDTVLFLLMGKTLMFRLYRKIERLWAVFHEQGNSPWYFGRDNFNRLINALSARDTEIFYMETKTLEWNSYLEDCVRTGRQYLCKDDLSTLPYAAKKVKIWWLVTTIMKWCLILFLIYCVIPQSFLSSLSSNFENLWYTSNQEFKEEAHGSISNEQRDTLPKI